MFLPDIIRGIRLNAFFKINFLKLYLIVTDVFIFGSHYMFIFLSALIIHNDLHLSEEDYICLHFPMLLKIKKSH